MPSLLWRASVIIRDLIFARRTKAVRQPAE
jgi:hypothetical protein